MNVVGYCLIILIGLILIFAALFPVLKTSGGFQHLNAVFQSFNYTKKKPRKGTRNQPTTSKKIITTLLRFSWQLALITWRGLVSFLKYCNK